MIKISIYILLIFSLTSCANFKGKEEGTSIDSKGNVISSDGKLETAETIYIKAKGALKREQYDEAIEEYRKIESNYPFSKYAEQSHIELAFAEYKLARWDGAIAIIDRFISMNNTSKLLPYAYYLRGLINFNRGKNFFNHLLPHVQIDKDPVNIRESFEDFNFVFVNYKESIYLEDSHKRMVYLRNTLASYELHVANYYFKRKAYIAVINRCNYLIEKYPNAPANVDALFFLKRAYESLMMTDNARDIEKIINVNYPGYDSIYFKEVLDNKIRRNILAISEKADDIAIGLGFDIEDQKADDFVGVYNVKYFTNDDLIEIPRNIKPEKYTIVHKKKDKIINIEEVVEEIKESRIVNYLSDDDRSDMLVEDIIVDKNKKNKDNKDSSIDKINKTNDKVEVVEKEIDKDKNIEKKDNKEETLGSENEIIELLEN